MNEYIKDIIEKYRSNKKTKYSNKYFFHDNSYHRQVNTNDDVKRAFTIVNNNIEYIEKVNYKLVNEDIELLEKALGKYEIAIHKVFQCFNNSSCNFSYSAEELTQLMSNWDMFEDRINKIRLKKAHQD